MGQVGITVEQNFQIRTAKTSDAKALNRYINEIYETSDHLITRPQEFQTSSFKQRFWIAKKQTKPSATCLLAIKDKKIIGMLDSWTDTRQRIMHSTCFAMSVHADHRQQKVGTKLLVHFINWVKKHETLDRIELHVHSDNKHAIKLYKSLGFTLEGTRRKTLRYEDGRVVDDHIMALWP